MRLVPASVIGVVVAVVSVAPERSAFAHGGSYQPPGGEVPDGSREPSDPPPPPDGSGPGTPGGETGDGPTTGGGNPPGGPTSDGGDFSGPGPGGGPTGGPPSGGTDSGGGPNTGPGGRGGRKASSEDWTHWWNANMEPLLQRKARLRERQRTAGTGSGVHAIGRGAGSGSVILASEARIRNDVVPALRALLATDPMELDADIRSAAALALCKFGEESVVLPLIEMARNERRSFDLIDVESALLGLGILQKDNPEVREFLGDVVQDRAMTTRFARPFAALSLGLLGPASESSRGASGELLLKVLDAAPKGPDVGPACLLGLGLLEDPQFADELLQMARTRKSYDGKRDLTTRELANCVSALGRIGVAGTKGVGEANAIVEHLVEMLSKKRARDQALPEERRSAAIALGRIASISADVKVHRAALAALRSAIEEDDDEYVGSFAIMATGRLAAAAQLDAELRASAISILRRQLEKGSHRDPTYAALALGIAGAAMGERGEQSDEESMRAPIRAAFAESKDARARGAFAIASGLLRDAKAVPALRTMVTDGRADPRLRGYAAVGLGMIAFDDASRTAVRDLLVNENDRDLRVQAATAAGLMGDPSVIQPMVAILQDRNQSQFVLGSVAMALGRFGDERAIDPLLAIVKNEKVYPTLTRAIATAALGQIGDRRDLPLLTKLSVDGNYKGQAPFEFELLTIL